MANESSLKVYVPVDVRFDETGRMLPHAIIWEDGTKYEIDKVTDIRPAPAQKAGGQGDRYTVRIGGKQSYLFFERAATVTGCSLGRWFVERKIDPVANDITVIYMPNVLPVKRDFLNRVLDSTSDLWIRSEVFYIF